MGGRNNAATVFHCHLLASGDGLSPVSLSETTLGSCALTCLTQARPQWGRVGKMVGWGTVAWVELLCLAWRETQRRRLEPQKFQR